MAATLSSLLYRYSLYHRRYYDSYTVQSPVQILYSLYTIGVIMAAILSSLLYRCSIYHRRYYDSYTVQFPVQIL